MTLHKRAALADRTLDCDAFWQHLYETTARPLAFRATTKDEWAAWRTALLAKLKELLGAPRPKVEPRVEVLETRDCGSYVRERVVYDTEPRVSVTAYVLRPKSARPKNGYPAMLVLHGHLAPGKEIVAGRTEWTIRGLKQRRSIWRFNKNYAEALAQRGYLCLCPDARGFGERADGFTRTSPRIPFPPFGKRDPCNVQGLNGQLFGLNLLWLNIWDDLRGLAYLASRPEVDARRIGALGSSWGGTRAMFAAALDERVKAAVVSSYLSTFYEQGPRVHQLCGTQILPGILNWCELGDVAALAAPRALFCENGIADTTFPIAAAKTAFETVRRVFEVAGVADRCEHEVHSGGHTFAANRAFTFLAKWLALESPLVTEVV